MSSCGERQRGDDGQVVAEARADGAPVDLFVFRVLDSVDGAVRVFGDARQELVGRREGHGPARARGRVASTRCALRRPANRWSTESGYIVKVTVETNSARMSEV